MLDMGLLGVLALFHAVGTVGACTAIGVTPGATADGSTLVTHSSDAEGENDPRVYKVAAAKHEPGSQRMIYDYPTGLSSSARVRTPIGSIAQVARTHGYLREGYAMMNDASVSIGESTTSSVSPIDEIQPVSRGGTALLGAYTLIELALERCDTGRCAVETMGSLAEQHGFYQDSGTPSGEAFVIGDRKEVWLFHILPPLSAANASCGAIWAAARVPDGFVTAVPNSYVIRTVELDSADYLYSRSMLDAALELGAWAPGEQGGIDFTRAFSQGEYGGKYYSGRRIWRALSLLGAPEAVASLPAEYDDLAVS